MFTTGKRANKRPSYRGKAQYDVVRGQPRVRGWPRKRPLKKTEKQIEQIEWFTQAVWATKYWPAEFQQTIREAVKGTPLYPRDVMLMLMSGRFAYITFDDEGTAYPMAARQDVSKSLDVLSSAPNSVLVRGEQWWTALSAPAPGMFLQSGVAGGPPQWNIPATTALYSRVEGGAPYNQPGSAYAKVQNWIAGHETVTMWDQANQQFEIPAGVNVVEVGFRYGINSGTGSNCTGRIDLNGAGEAWNLISTGAQLWQGIITPPIEVVAGDIIDFKINMVTNRVVAGGELQRAWVKVLG